MPDKAFTDFFNRLCEAVGSNKYTFIADVLEVTPQSISQFIKQEKFPSDRIINYCFHNGISLDWMFAGKGAMKKANHHYAEGINNDGLSNASVVNEEEQTSGEIPIVNKNILDMINLFDISDEDFCRRLEISGEELRRIRYGAPVSGIMLRAICYEFDVRMRWLRDNEGPVRAEIGSPAVKDLWAQFSNAYRKEIDKS